MNLKQARQQFPQESMFLSATKNVKAPLKVNFLRYAIHQDRVNKVIQIERELVRLNNLNNTYSTNFKNLKMSEQFILENEKALEERAEILSMKRDIVEDSGGVIWCSETSNTAVKC